MTQERIRLHNEGVPLAHLTVAATPPASFVARGGGLMLSRVRADWARAARFGGSS